MVTAETSDDVESLCGDSIVGPAEHCDDGNVEMGDGCNTECTVEADWECDFGSSPSICKQTCAIAEVGTPCDDRDPDTVNDVCQSDGCHGVNVCLGVACPAPPALQCRGPGRCSVDLVSGSASCGDFSEVADGTSCNDGDPETLNDECQAGVCVGVNPCAAISCDFAPNPCQGGGLCLAGSCIYQSKPNGLSCDDGDENTSGDVCRDGECIGIVGECRNPPCERCPETRPRGDLNGDCVFDAADPDLIVSCKLRAVRFRAGAKM